MIALSREKACEDQFKPSGARWVVNFHRTLTPYYDGETVGQGRALVGSGPEPDSVGLNVYVRLKPDIRNRPCSIIAVENSMC